jgi:hypothetical protein
MNESQPQPSTPKTWQFASIVSTLGKWAWIAGLINGILELIFAFVGIGLGVAANAVWYPVVVYSPAYDIWQIIGAIILIFVSFAIIRPKFSNKCADQDWEALYNWTLALGNTKIPWMLIWGIIFTIFSWAYWGGILVLLPAILLIFMGTRPYNWS